MESKNRKERILVCLTVLLCVIIVSLCWFESRLIGWRPFANIGEEGLYYASFRRGNEEKINLLSDKDMEEFAELMQNIWVRSSGIWYEDYYFMKEENKWKILFEDIYTIGWSKWGLVFETVDQKGQMIQIRTYRYLTKGEDGDLDNENVKYGLIINDEYCFISERSYQAIEQFVGSLQY